LIRLEEWVDIVSLHKQGLSIKAIARKLGLSRNTVRAALRRDGPPEREPQHRPPSKLELYKDYLVGRLTEFPELSVEALFDEIRELGYAGQISILKDFTRPYRVRRREPVVRFETPPGLQAQVDFADLGRHEIAGAPTDVYLFVMVLGFSRALYVEAITDCRSETFLSCHVNAFAAFGGMPREILYDNAKVVAIEHSRTVLTFNASLLDFAGRYGFRPRLCRPYRAKTKGKVERAIRYVKDRCLTGRSFTGIDDMNAQIAHWVEDKANRRTHATTGERPVDRLAREGLTPLTSAMPWCSTLPAPRPGRVLFRFEELPVVEARPLSVYEEACT
jgi:transposase